jgi:hypothetical protein
MRRILRLVAIVVLGLMIIIAAALLLSPSARRLAPVWLYYDLVGRRLAPVPPEVEQFVLTSGLEYCSVGRDSDCGGYRLVGARTLAVDQAAQQRGISAAWCVDYVVLRRNLGRTTSGIIYWANIARAMIVAQASDGHFDSSRVADCRTARLE